MEDETFIPAIDRDAAIGEESTGTERDRSILASPPCQAELILDMNILRTFQTFLAPPDIAAIYGEFLRLTRDRLGLLVGNPSGEMLENEAHTIAGTAGMLGACQLAARAKELTAATGHDASLTTAISRLYAACDALGDTLHVSQVNY